MGEGEVVVRREGYSRAQHIYSLYNGRTIARLRWRGMRRAVYETDGFSFDINVGALDKRIAIIPKTVANLFWSSARARTRTERAASRDGRRR